MPATGAEVDPRVVEVGQGVCAGKFVAPCVPQTCADLGVACGQALDGCCTMLDCGACPTGLTCAQGVCLPVCM